MSVSNEQSICLDDLIVILANLKILKSRKRKYVCDVLFAGLTMDYKENDPKWPKSAKQYISGRKNEIVFTDESGNEKIKLSELIVRMIDKNSSYGNAFFTHSPEQGHVLQKLICILLGEKDGGLNGVQTQYAIHVISTNIHDLILENNQNISRDSVKEELRQFINSARQQNDTAHDELFKEIENRIMRSGIDESLARAVLHSIFYGNEYTYDIWQIDHVSAVNAESMAINAYEDNGSPEDILKLIDKAADPSVQLRAVKAIMLCRTDIYTAAIDILNSILSGSDRNDDKTVNFACAYLCWAMNARKGTPDFKIKKKDIVYYLEKAVHSKCSDAEILKARLLIDGECGFPRDLVEAKRLLDGCTFTNRRVREQHRSAINDYYFAKAEAENDERNKVKYYEEAAKNGSRKAFACLKNIQYKSASSVREPVLTGDAPKDKRNVLFLNSDPVEDSSRSPNRIVYESIPKVESWNMLFGENRKPENIDYANAEKIVFSLMSLNQSKNLIDMGEIVHFLLDVLRNEPEEAQDALIRKTDIFVFNETEVGPRIVDAVMNDLPEDVYFRVHLIDRDIAAADELVCSYPTFLPCLGMKGGRYGGSREAARRIIILGSGRGAKEILRQIIGVSYLKESGTSVLVIGPQADRLRNEFFEQCPQLLASKNDSADYIIPDFRCMNLNELPLNLKYEDKPEIDAVQKLLYAANYFVITTESDTDNLELGIRLRQNLLRRDPDPYHRPVINVRISDEKLRKLADGVAMSTYNYSTDRGMRFRYHWTEDYTLNFFGSDCMFEIDRLLNNKTEKMALELHKSYYDAMFSENKAATADFYRRYYNRDSSKAAYEGLPYLCFALALEQDASEYEVGNYAALSRLLEDYLKKDTVTGSPLDTAAKIEHARWMGYMTSRGWSRPGSREEQTYLENDSAKHQLEMALLHPYIVAYADLPKALEQLNKVITTARKDMKKLHDPRDADKAFVQKAIFLLKGEKGSEKGAEE